MRRESSPAHFSNLAQYTGLVPLPRDEAEVSRPRRKPRTVRTRRVTAGASVRDSRAMRSGSAALGCLP